MEFRLGAIPIRIHGAFFITAVLLSGAWSSPVIMAEWTAVVLVSVLLHELGHALMGRAFGLAPRIDLHAMGGTTSWTAARGRITSAKSVAISLAGPGAGLVLGVLVFVALLTGAIPPNEIAQQIAWMAIQVNVGWGLVNLLPMLPMDGGNVLYAILNGATGGRGERPARIVSIVTAVAVALVGFLVFRQWWLAILSALFAFDNLRALRSASAASA